MPPLKDVRTSLEVGFPNGDLPERMARFRGRVTRAIGETDSFPFEDEQFDVVMIDGKIISSALVKEAHRVLHSGGWLLFVVAEKTGQDQSGYTMPEVYSMIREGFNILSVERTPWWRFGRGGRTISIGAQKKNWRSYRSLSVGGQMPISPFCDGGKK